MMSEDVGAECSEVKKRNENETSSANRLGLCELCGGFAKYSCPCCEVKTCSLGCVKQHKTDSGCSGERNKTAFKTLSNFTNLDLLSDYRMLEETTRSLEKYKRDRLKRQYNLPPHLHRLKAAVTKRGSSFIILPQHSSRRKKNTTFFNWSNGKIQWRVEWIFPQAAYIKAIDERILEEIPLSISINKYLNPKTCPMELQEKLEFYQSAGLSGIFLLLKAEGVKKSSSRFFQLDPELTLKHALKNKCIVEYPTIYVVLTNHKDVFEIIDSDEELEIDPEMYCQTRTHCSSKNKCKEAQKPKKNLLLYESEDSSSDDNSEEKEKKRKQDLRASGFHIPDYNQLINENV